MTENTTETAGFVDRVLSHRLKVTALVVGIALVSTGLATDDLGIVLVGAAPFALGTGQLATYWGTHYDER